MEAFLPDQANYETMQAELGLRGVCLNVHLRSHDLLAGLLGTQFDSFEFLLTWS